MSINSNEIYYFDISKIARDFTGSKDISILFNDQALRESITNILATEPGERVMNPEFGCRLSKYVFEPIDDITAYNIKAEIKFALEKFEPRIDNLFINVNPLEDLNTFDIDIIFNLKINNNKQQTISIRLNKIR